MLAQHAASYYVAINFIASYARSTWANGQFRSLIEQDHRLRAHAGLPARRVDSGHERQWRQRIE